MWRDYILNRGGEATTMTAMSHRHALGIVASVLLLAGPAGAQESPAPKSLPYTAVHDAQFIRPADATFMNAGDRVIGLMSGTTAKAYPAGILSQHGLVEDQSPTGPIAITW
jgi:hypothetical protein